MFTSGKILIPTVTAAFASVAGYSSYKYYNNNNLFSGSIKPINAIAVLQSDNNSGVTGVIKFSQSAPGQPVRIYGTVNGLSSGCHGFHVHSYGNLTKGCTSAGGHFNPFNREHGGPEDTERHVGDLGNIHSKDGVCVIEKNDKLIQLSGELSIIGRAIVVHADKDDLGKGGHSDSKTTGHAGARVACAVIGLDE